MYHMRDSIYSPTYTPRSLVINMITWEQSFIFTQLEFSRSL